MRRHFCEHILDDFFYHNKPLLYTDIVKDRGFLCQLLTQLYSDSQVLANNLSKKADSTALSSYVSKDDFPNNFKFLNIEADASSYDTEVLERISSLNSATFIIFCEHGSVSMYMGYIVSNGEYGTVLRFEYDSLYVNGCAGSAWTGWTKLR